MKIVQITICQINLWLNLRCVKLTFDQITVLQNRPICLGLISLKDLKGQDPLQGGWPRWFVPQDKVCISPINQQLDDFCKKNHLTNSKFGLKLIRLIVIQSIFIRPYFIYIINWYCTKVTLGSTACESMIAAGNVFLGLAEAPLLIRPYIKKLTPSELHSVMTR